jgi:Protein of unknown function (DUF3592)
MEKQVPPPERLGAEDVAGSPPPATAAIRHPATRAAFRQRQSGPHRLVGGSLVLLMVWAIVVGWSQAPSDRLAATGLDTSGEVVEVRGPPRISLFDSGSVVVAYQVEQEPAPRRAVVRLNDLSPAYQAGDHVQVLYDPDAPARATIAGEGNEQPLLVALGILTFVFGGMGLPIGLVLWLGGRMLHHEPMPCRSTARGVCVVTSGRAPLPPCRPAITPLDQANLSHLSPHSGTNRSCSSCEPLERRFL